MPVSVLQRKIERLPQEYVQKVNDYVELLLFKCQAQEDDSARRERIRKLAGGISDEDAKIMMDAIAECRRV